MRRAARVDANQPELVAQLRGIPGLTVQHLHAVGAGCPDLLVGYMGVTALPKVAKAPTKLYAETRTLVAVADGLLLGQQAVNYNILHTPVRELSLQVPQGASVLTVTGPNVQDWRVGDDGRLQVLLRGEVIGGYSLRLTYEQPTTGQAGKN